MDNLKTEIINFVANFIKVTEPFLIAIGLIIAVISMFILGLKIITNKNAEDRTSVLENSKWIVIGILALGIFIPLVSYMVINFFN